MHRMLSCVNVSAVSSTAIVCMLWAARRSEVLWLCAVVCLRSDCLCGQLGDMFCTGYLQLLVRRVVSARATRSLPPS